MEKYLQQLLKEVNTVIIPGLGALTVTNHSTGEMMFMPYLKYDDGKLSSYIAERKGSSIEEAKDFILSKVEEIINGLENDGVSNLSGVGVFTKSSNGDIEFKPNEISTIAVEEELSIEESDTEEELIVSENTVIEEPILENLSENEVYNESLPVIEDELLENSSDNDEVEEVVIKKKGLFSFLKSNSDKSFSSNTEEEIIEFGESEEEFSSPTEEEAIDFEEEERVIEEFVDYNEGKEEELNSTEDLSSESEISDLSEEVISENEIFSSELEDFNNDGDLVNHTNKKKRGVKFWLFTLLILLVLGGGTYVGINFEKFKHYLPFVSKTDTSQEKKIIEKLESDNTKPSSENITKTEEMIHSPEVTEEKNTVVTEEAPVVSETNEKPKLANKNTSKTTEKISTEVQSNDGSNKSFIILGTFSEQVNAINLLDKIVSQGIKSASILEREGKFSVCYASFPTKEEAVSKLSDAKSAFKSAWIFNKP